MMTPLLAAVMSTWTPPMAGSCVQWLKASHGVTITGAGVSTQLDLHGGKNATQGTDANRPPMGPGLNGRPTIQFNAAGKMLTHTLRLEPPCTIATVAYGTTGGGIYHTIGAWSPGAVGMFLYAANGAGTNNWGCYANADINSGHSLATFKRAIVIAHAYTNMDFRTNGVSVNNSTGGASGYNSGLGSIGDSSGGGQPLNGEVAEVICFSVAQSVAVCQRIEALQAVEYGL